MRERIVKEVYDNYEFLRRLTEKRFADMVLGDEAYSFAFDRLAQDDWRRVRAYKGKSSFRGYLGCVWCRLLEDFAIKKFGKITPPQWIKNLGGVWEELFKLLCCRRFSVDEAIERIVAEGRYDWEVKGLEKASAEILAKIPTCGRTVGPAFSMDDDPAGSSTDPGFQDQCTLPDDLAIEKERWMALQAIAKVFFIASNQDAVDDPDPEKLAGLVAAIRDRLRLDEEERLILTAHFVDGEPISAVGRRLKLNRDQIHGRFRRLRKKIRSAFSGLLEMYL